MDLTHVLAQLHAELAHLDAAIASLERLQQESRKPGRPPKAISELKRPRRNTDKSAAAANE
jgi:hypothetical protein